jgi:DNA-binding transcriptional ArsR family regulator
VASKKKPNGPSGGKASSEKKRLPLKQRLIKALTHPLRVKILALMNGREWSPRELEEELGEGLSQVSYHVKVLRDYELIEMTKTAPKRGAVEHYYRAIERAFVPSGMAKNIPKSAERIIGDDILKVVDKDLGASLKSGRFYERDDWHASWTPADLDDQGCQDAEMLADAFIEDFLAIAAASAGRIAKGEDESEPIPISAVVLVFGSDLAEKDKAPSRKKAPSREKKRSNGKGHTQKKHN